MINENYCCESVDYWNRPGNHAGIMPAAGFKDLLLPGFVGGGLGLHDRCHGFKSNVEINIHTITDTALYTT